MDKAYPENVNFSSPEWANFCLWLENEKQELYRKLASSSNNWDATQNLRGQVAYITKLLDLRETAADFRPR